MVGAGPAEVGGWWTGGGMPTLLAERLDRGVLLDDDRMPCPTSSKPMEMESTYSLDIFCEKI